MPDDTMFDPLAAKRSATIGGPAEAPKPVPVIPVPLDAPPCDWQPRYGVLAGTWAYLNEEARLVGYTARINCTRDGRRDKDVLPITYCRVEEASGHHHEWCARGVPAPRPLYRLVELLANPKAPVIICEGEKQADAVPRLFPGYLGTTSMGGARAARLSDWTPVAGHDDLVFWPDNDGTGRSYVEAGAQLVMAAGAACVRIVQVPAGWPEGWDLADPLPDGVTTETLRELLRSTTPWASRSFAGEPRIAAEDWRQFGPYSMTDQGLFWIDPEGEKPKLFLAGSFEVLAQTRDTHSSDWGLLLRWSDPDRRAHEWAMPREVLGGRGDQLWRSLLRNGLTIASSTTNRNKLADYLGSVRVQARARCVKRIGWHASASGPVFVLPDVTFGKAGDERVIWQTETRNETFFNVSGSIEAWREEVARRCIGNSRLVTAVSTSFAPPLLEFANEESGGIHLVGKSRTGKTVALRVAGSVWGGGGINGFIRTWRATANGLEGIAEVHSDALLPFDEMGQVDARESGEIAYMLANGAGKGRAGRDGSARRSAQWRLLFLSSW